MEHLGAHQVPSKFVLWHLVGKRGVRLTSASGGPSCVSEPAYEGSDDAMLLGQPVTMLVGSTRRDLVWTPGSGRPLGHRGAACARGGEYHAYACTDDLG